MMNLANMMKQAQQVQKRLQEAQKDLAETEIKAEAANGAVTVVCDGHGKFKSSVEMLEDLITTAMKQATADAQKKMQDKMKGIVPAGINIPGLF